MAFNRPTLPELITRTTADLVSRLELTGTVLRRAVVRVLARVYAGAVHSLHGHLDWAARQVLASTADAEQLDLHGLEYGITRLPASYAQGSISWLGTAGAVAPAGTVLQRSDGVQYSLDAELVFAASSVNGTVTAIAAGAAGNADAGVQLTLVSPIAGVTSTATVTSAGLTSGTDTETDAAYRARVLARKRATPHGGAVVDYERWALEVSGVTRVWIVPQYDGPGSVGVIIADDAAGIVPSPTLVSEVQAYIDDDSRKPVTAVVIVTGPTLIEVDLTITLSPHTSALRAAVTDSLQSYFLRSGPGDTVYPSQLSEAISQTAGEEWHVLAALPGGVITTAADELPVLGTITWIAP